MLREFSLLRTIYSEPECNIDVVRDRVAKYESSISCTDFVLPKRVSLGRKRDLF